MLTYRDISASVRVDGIDLPQYRPDYDDETRTVTCWIPSEAGKPYALWWKLERDIGPGLNILSRIYLDGGDEVQGAWLSSTMNISGTAIDAFPLSDITERPFIFINMALTGGYFACDCNATPQRPNSLSSPQDNNSEEIEPECRSGKHQARSASCLETRDDELSPVVEAIPCGRP